MKRLLPLICWLATVPAGLAAGIEFEARLWSPELAGLARVGDSDDETTIDLVADLGLADEEVPEGRLIWRPTRRTSLRLSYASFELAGNVQLDRPVSFGGTTFQLDAQVSSLLELEFGGLGIAWQPLSSGDGRFRLGPLVAARGLRGEAAISTDILGLVPISASDSFEFAFAAAGLVLDIEPSSKVHLYAEWTTTVESDDGDLVDAEAGLRYYPLDLLAVTIGYRRLEIDATDGNELFDLVLDGPFLGGVLRF